MEEITKVQELIYTTKVEKVMANDVIVIPSSLTMAEAKQLMQEKRVSGVPVMDGDKMVGIVSMSDVIDCLEKGDLDSPVTKNMTKHVRTILKDATAMEAVHCLGRNGYGRVPVVDQAGALVGVVTTGTIIRALLHQMDVSFKKKEEEDLQAYRASHIFDDIESDDTGLVMRFVVDARDFTNAGKASSMIKKSLQRLKISPPFIRRVAVAVYEAEMNLVIHTDVGGVIKVDIRRERLFITAFDHGPGIEDVTLVLQPGFSTAPEWIRDMGFGAGMGLANIKRCSDSMRLVSSPGGATKLDILFLFGDQPLGKKGPAGKKP